MVLFPLITFVINLCLSKKAENLITLENKPKFKITYFLFFYFILFFLSEKPQKNVFLSHFSFNQKIIQIHNIYNLR